MENENMFFCKTSLHKDTSIKSIHLKFLYIDLFSSSTIKCIAQKMLIVTTCDLGLVGSLRLRSNGL